MNSRQQRRIALYFLAPALSFFLVFWAVPMVLTLFYALTEWRVGGPSFELVGLGNYIDLVSDPQFRASVIASAKIAGYAIPPSLALALLLAVVLANPRIKAGRMWRLIIIAPVVTDWVATGLVWQLIFLPNQGILAALGQQYGVDFLTSVRWTSSSSLAPIAIAIFIIWKQTGLYAIFFLAALKGIPISVIEAAQIDGATPWQAFWRIRWPLMRPITVFVVAFSFIITLGLFEPIFILTGGGPGNATRTLPIFLFENFFTFGNSGYASAAGIYFLAFSLLGAFVATRLLKEQYEA